jgi:hypothetical protein
MKILKIIFDWFLICLPRWGNTPQPKSEPGQNEKNNVKGNLSKKGAYYDDPGPDIYAE